MGVMSLSEILDRSIDILKKYIKSIVLFSLCYGFIYTGGVLVFAIGGGIFIALSAAITSDFVIPAILLVLIVIVAVILVLASRVGIIKIASQEFSGTRVGFGEAMKASLKSLPKLFGILLIEILLSIPAFAVIGGAVYLIFNNLDAATDFVMGMGMGLWGTLVIILFIFIILVISVVIQMYYTWFSFTLHAAVLEKRGTFASVKRSFSLVRKNFWKIFGITLLIGYTVYAIQSSLSSFITAILSLLYLLVKFLNLPMDFLSFLNLTYSIANFPISILSWLVITPIGTIMTTLLYYNQRFKKEGYDMVIGLREIQKNDERKLSGELV